MADLKLDASGDLLIEDDSLVIVSGDDALVQHLKIRLQFFLGEWFLDTRLGIPYYENIFIKSPDLITVRGILSEAITETPGIESLAAFNLDYDAVIRKLLVTFTAVKSDGELLDFSEDFIIGPV